MEPDHREVTCFTFLFAFALSLLGFFNLTSLILLIFASPIIPFALASSWVVNNWRDPLVHFINPAIDLFWFS